MAEDDLSALWRRQWPECPLLAHDLKHAFHLHRDNTVLDELFHGQEVRIVTADWSDAPDAPALSAQHALWNPGARHGAAVWLGGVDGGSRDRVRWVFSAPGGDIGGSPLVIYDIEGRSRQPRCSSSGSPGSWCGYRTTAQVHLRLVGSPGG